MVSIPVRKMRVLSKLMYLEMVFDMAAVNCLVDFEKTVNPRL
jgi:hypothetical protein